LDQEQDTLSLFDFGYGFLEVREVADGFPINFSNDIPATKPGLIR